MSFSAQGTALKQRQCVNWRQENTIQSGTMEGGDGSLYPPPSQNPGILSPACWAVSCHPWGLGPHLGQASPLPPHSFAAVDITCPWEDAAPPTCISFSSAAPTGKGGPGPRYAAGSLRGPHFVPPRAGLQAHHLALASKGILYPSLHPPLPGPLQFPLIPHFRLSLALPLRSLP